MNRLTAEERARCRKGYDDEAMVLTILDSLDAAEAEIARLTESLQQIRDLYTAANDMMDYIDRTYKIAVAALEGSDPE